MKLKEKSKWYEWYICKVWRANYAMNQNEAQRHFALNWGLKTKFVTKPHYCSFSDRDHEAVMIFEEKLKTEPKSKPIVFKNVDDFIRSLKDESKRD